MTVIRRCIGIVGLFGLLAGCNTNSTTGPTPTFGPSTIVTVQTASGVAVAGIVVTLSSGLNGTTPTGVITTQTTNTNGQVTFSNLPTNQILCVSAAQGIGSSAQFAGHCANPFPATYKLKF